MNTDPTRDEMLTFLAGFYPSETTPFDREEAIYWFAYDYHNGATSNLYSALSVSPYRPGPSRNGCDPDGISTMLYDELAARFGFSADD